MLDQRPEEEYRTAGISGALSVPLDHLKEILARLPTDQEIVAYCRSPYCMLAV
jgi:rhodanese-related sulfurtransferase